MSDVIMPQPSYAERQIRNLATMIVRTSLEAATDIVTLQREGATRQAGRAQEQWMAEVYKILSDAFMASAKLVEQVYDQQLAASLLAPSRFMVDLSPADVERLKDLKPGPIQVVPRYLTAAMDNTLAWKLGRICRQAASPEQSVGDPIDRGLILRRLLEEGGFGLVAL